MEKDKIEVMYALNEVAKVVNNELFIPKSIDVGKVVFVIHRGGGDAYGYCYVSCNFELNGVPLYGYCYVSRNFELNGVPLREIAITPKGLYRPLPAIVATVAHELVHASNCVDGVNDCNGFRHNNRFKARCDLVGVPAEKDKIYGWTTSCDLWDAKMMEDIISKIDPKHVKVLEELNNKSSVVRAQFVHVCPECGVNARARPTANLICGDCIAKMEVEE